MTELQPKYVAPFVPHKVKYALERIGLQRETFIEAFQDESTIQALKALGVNLRAETEVDGVFRFDSPLGEIKAEFVCRLEGDYLGVMAVYSHLNKHGDYERFFFVQMNHETPWVDSTGAVFRMNFHSDKPELSEFTQFMRRVLAVRLQAMDSALLAI